MANRELHPIDLLDAEKKKKLEVEIKECIEVGLSPYAADTLQEYVMLILKNKKLQNQISVDLSAFLGENTQPFVDWCVNQIFDLFTRNML